MAHSLQPIEPNTGFERWLDSRLPISAADARPVPGVPDAAQPELLVDLRRHPHLHAASSQIATGVVLAMHYVPTPEHAPSTSVENIMRDVNWGWLLRYTHAVGASMFFLAAYIHTFRGLYYGSYKAPREMLVDPRRADPAS